MLGFCCDCCDNIYTVGCFDPCGLVFDFGDTVSAGDAGEWVLTASQGRRNVRFEATLAESDPIVFNLDGLNEHYTYVFTLTKPDGTTYTKTIDAVDYDCFKLSTRLGGDSQIQL